MDQSFFIVETSRKCFNNKLLNFTKVRVFIRLHIFPHDALKNI